MNKEYLVDVEDDLQNLEGFNSIKDIGWPDFLDQINAQLN